ncbi:MAG: hypothetical protein EOO68_07405 [Moraxellaceae bacterium]|nr:MAG: hypothetical protein EOO68_07405 [Moraxellaceae bacterium]
MLGFYNSKIFLTPNFYGYSLQGTGDLTLFADNRTPILLGAGMLLIMAGKIRKRFVLESRFFNFFERWISKKSL